MKNESKNIFLDSNVLIYETFGDFDAEKHEDVCRELKYISDNNYNVYVSSQVLREFLAISTDNKFFERPLSIEEAFSKMDEYKKNFNILYDSELSMSKLKHLASKYQICKQDIHDTNIVATMVANQLEDIYTFNIKDFRFYKEINLYKSKGKDAEKQKPEPSEITPPVESPGN
jgi:predicted nucleic acid-binding protein